MRDSARHVMCSLLALTFVVPPGATLEARQPQPRSAAPSGPLDLAGLNVIDVDPTTGNLLYRRDDLVLGAADQRFAVRRTYRPFAGTTAHTGTHWVSALDLRLRFNAARTAVVFVGEGGGPLSFQWIGTRYVALEGRAATVERTDWGYKLSGLGDERTYAFDSEGRILARSGRSGNTVTWKYDRAKRLAALEGPWGKLQLVRDDLGRLASLKGPGGVEVRYHFDRVGNLISVVRGGARELYAYDAAGRLASLAGGRATVAYDASHRVVRLAGKGILPVRLRYAFDARRGTETQVVRGGRTFRVLVSPDRRRVERRMPNGARQVTTLDARGRPVKLALGGGLAWTWRYDAQGRLTEAGSPQGTTRYTYGDKSGARPQQIDHADGRRVRFGYDAGGNVISVQASGRGTTRYAYDDQSRVRQITDARGAVTKLSRNERGYLVAIDQQGIGVTRIERGPDGNMRSITGPDGRVTRLVSTHAGRLLRVADKRGVIYEARYDLRGQLIQSRDEFGRVRRYTWNARGQMTAARDKLGVLARFRYDAAGRYAAITDGAGSTVRYRRPDEQTLVIEDSSAGRRVLKSDRLGRLSEELRGNHRVRYSYDARGKLSARATHRGVDRYRYDDAGRLAALIGPDGGFRFGYDPAGRLSSVFNTALKKGVRYSYNAAGDRTGLRLPWGTQRYHHDVQGRVVGITTPAGKTIRFTLLKDGRRKAIHYPNGVTTRFKYKRGYLTIVETRRGKKVLDRRSYSYDKSGRVKSVTDRRGRTTRYTRDARGRLLTTRSPAREVAFGYDGAGNRTQEKRAGQAIDTKVGPGNRLLRQGERTFRYGPTGALASTRSPEGVTRYGYDHDDRLVRVERPDGTVVRYGYAPNGARLWREGDRGKTHFLHDAMDVVGEYRGGRLRSSYVHGPGLDDVLAVSRQAKTYYYHYDLVRSVTAMTNDRGKVAARYRYDAFGRTLSARGKASSWNTVRYTSRTLDKATGLYDYRARAYDPQQGRFTSPDPFGRKGGLNLYAYVGNDPTLFNDPFGLWPAWLDRAVEKTKDFAASAARSVVNVAEGAWNVGKQAAGALGDALLMSTRVQYAFAKGFVNGLWAAAKGTWNAVTNPGETWRALKWAWNNMDQVKAALGDKWEEYKTAFFNDPEKFAEMTGHILGEVAFGVLGTKGLGLVLKGAGAGKVAAAIANKAGSASRKLSKGAGAAAAAGGRAVTAGAKRLPKGNARGIRGALAGEKPGASRALPKVAGCFLAGTLVLTAQGARAIETVQVGERVWSRDEHTGQQGYKPVVRLFRGRTERVIVVEVAGLRPAAQRGRTERHRVGEPGGEEAPEPPSASTLRCTSEHPFWVEGQGWVPAARLRVGDRLVSDRGQAVQVVAHTVLAQQAEHYNFEVADWHTYFVAERAEGVAVWVHNTCFEAAKKLGYSRRIPPQKVPFDSHGKPAFFHPKLKKYITPDVDQHKGGVWKMFDRKGRRVGTYDKNLNRIGD